MKKSKKILLLAAVAVFVGIVFAGFVAQYYLDNRRPNFQKEYVLYVYPDMTAEQVLDSIVVGAQAERPRSVEHVFKKMNVAENMKPGRYVVETSKPSIYVARMLVYGWQTPQNLTLSGTIRSKERLVKKISNQMMVSADEVAAALEDSTFLAQYGFTPENVFAMIMQDTYQMYWTASVKDIFDRFKKEYDAFWTEERLAKAKKQGLSQMEVSVVASIVSGETLKKFEYPKIAGVYLNRYKKGMKLQADPTVCFCYDYTLDRVLKKHLTIDSPYNTYKYAGLPPGPIRIPSIQGLESVLNHAHHNYLYMCAKEDFSGTHNFAVTSAQHAANARRYQQALNRRNIK